MAAKRWFMMLFLAVFLVSCTSPVTPTPSLPSPTNMPTVAAPALSLPSSTPSATPAPSSTPTTIPSPSPSPTIKPPVSVGTPVPNASQLLTAANSKQIQLLADYRRYNPGYSLIKLSLDRKFFFVCSGEGTDVYDASTGQLVRHLEVPVRQGMDGYFSNDLQFTLDDSRFMARTSDSEVTVYTFEGQTVFSYSFPSLLGGSGGAALSPDGKQLVLDVCSDCNAYKGQSGFKVVDVDSGQTVYENGQTPGGEARGWMPIFSPDGKILATQIGSQMMLWDTQTWKRVNDFAIGTQFIYQRANFSTNSSTLAIFEEGQITLWNLKDRRMMWQYKVCKNQIPLPPVLFSPDDAYVAVPNCEKIVVVNGTDGSPVSEQDIVRGASARMSLGNDGQLTTLQPQSKPGVAFAPWNMVYSFRGFNIFEEQGSMGLDFVSHAYPGNACSISFSAAPVCAIGDFIMGSNGKIYQAVTTQAHHVEIREGSEGSGASIVSLDWSGYLFQPFGLDNKHGMFFYVIWSDAHHATSHMMDTTSGKDLAQWPFSYNGMPAYSPDEKLVAFILWKNPGSRLMVFDLEKRQEIYQADSIWSTGALSFSPDGEHLAHFAGGSTDREPNFYYILDLSSSKKNTRYQFPTIPQSAPLAVSYSSDGTLVATGFRDGTIRFFDAANGSIVYEWKANSQPVYAMAFSPDNKYFAAAYGDATIQIWGIWP